MADITNFPRASYGDRGGHRPDLPSIVVRARGLGVSPQELHDHEEAFHSFSKLVLFAILHISLVLACLALAFLGNAPLLALLIAVGGTIAMILGFAISG
jgi:hypothetical protein